jgi:hypothetical protein
MAASTNSASGMVSQEQEMPRNQYGIVDTCFEEGQYEAGIAVLNQLRSPKHKPAPYVSRALRESFNYSHAF